MFLYDHKEKVKFQTRFDFPLNAVQEALLLRSPDLTFFFADHLLRKAENTVTHPFDIATEGFSS